MDSSETFIKAAANRIIARFGQKMIETAVSIAVKAKDAPEKIKAEWILLKEEIIEEAEKIKKEESKESNNTNKKINSIRKKLALLSRKVEE